MLHSVKHAQVKSHYVQQAHQNLMLPYLQDLLSASPRSSKCIGCDELRLNFNALTQPRNIPRRKVGKLKKGETDRCQNSKELYKAHRQPFRVSFHRTYLAPFPVPTLHHP